VEEKIRTQVLLPRDKIDPDIVYDLQLAVMLYEVSLLGPDIGPKNQAYVEDCPEVATTPAGGVIPLEEGILLEALPAASHTIAPLEAPAEFSSL
jgi:hypothetical protein